MIGHGNSDDPPHECAMADFTRYTLQFMDALGLDRVILAGNHSGAALSMSLAVNHPERVKRVVLSVEMLASPQMIAAFLEKLKGKPLSRELPMTADGSFLAEAWGRYRALGPTAPLAVRFKAFVIGQAARLRPYDAHYPVLRWMAEAETTHEVSGVSRTRVWSSSESVCRFSRSLRLTPKYCSSSA